MKKNRLKTLRKEKGDNQSVIASLLGVNVKTVSRWEKGENEIKLAQANMLANHFGVSVEYLLGFSDFRTAKMDSQKYKIIGENGMKETENFKQDVTLESILHLFFSEPFCYLNGKEIGSLYGLDLNSTVVTCIYIDHLGDLILELEVK